MVDSSNYGKSSIEKNGGIHAVGVDDINTFGNRMVLHQFRHEFIPGRKPCNLGVNSFSQQRASKSVCIDIRPTVYLDGRKPYFHFTFTFFIKAQTILTVLCFIVFSKYNTDSEKGKWSYTLKPDGTFESVLNINYNYNPRGVSLNPVFDSHKPVVFVSFNDAAEYAKFNQMRLPTEQEWELASLSGLKQEVNLAELDSTAWSFNELDKYSICQDVGLLKSNGLGLFDMFGNVSEWTIGSQILPGGERAEKEPIKGGSFVNKKNEINSKMSSLGARDFSYGDVGFRCVKDVKY
jgi:hypothetical protein